MTQDREAQARGTVTALRRPPVRQSIVVRSGRPHTFDAFVRTIGIWWPVTPFSAGKGRGDSFVLHGVIRNWTIREWNEALVPERSA